MKDPIWSKYVLNFECEFNILQVEENIHSFVDKFKLKHKKKKSESDI